VIPDDNQPTKGVIIGKDRSQVNVIFKRMPENQFFFLKENNPISHHEGIVVEKNGEIFLYMTNILGTEL
jgi:hypothetical protein